MECPFRTNEELIEEIAALKKRIEELEKSESVLMEPCKTLQSGEQEYRSTFENAMEGILRIDPDGRLLIINPAFANIMGYESPQELMSSMTEIAAHLFVNNESYCEFLHMNYENKTVKAFEMTACRKDGTICRLSVNSRLVNDDHGKTIYIEGFITDITDNMRLKDELKNIMREHRIIIDNANIAISLVQNRKQTWVNRKTEEMFQYPKEEMVGQTTRKLYPSQEAYERLGAEAYPVLARGETYETVQELIRRDGVHIQVRYIGRAIDPPDLSIGTLWLLEDITDRFRMEESLRKAHEELVQRVAVRTEELKQINEELRSEIVERKLAEKYLRETEKLLTARNILLQTLIDNLPFDIWAVDSENRYILQNSMSKNLWGDCIGRRTPDLDFPAETLERWETNNRCTFEGKTVDDEFRVKMDEKELFYHEIVAPLKQGRDIIGIVGANIDITDRKQAEEELHKSEERFRIIFENAVEGIFQTTPDGRYLGMNPSFFKMFGFDSSHEMIETVTDIGQQLYVNPDDREKLKDLLVRQGKVEGFEVELYRKDRTRFWVSINVRAVFDPKGSILYWEGTNEDITSRKHAEDRIRASLHEKEVLLKEIQHRVKNNLLTISGILALQLNRIKDDESRDTMITSMNRINAITKIHTKLYQSESYSNVNLSEYTKELLWELSRSYGLLFENITARIGDISIDVNTAIPLGLIVNELVTNSMKHAFPDPEKGKIAIIISKEGSRITLTVSDNGVGLPANIDFNNTESVGLSLLNQLVKQIDGNIELHQENGTQFIITFSAD
jgi:PAS domain S-box-containing protein